MQKIAAVFLTILFCVTLLVGCGEKEGYKNGTYTVSFENFDNSNYKDTLSLTVENGVVTRLSYNAVNPEGNLKTNDEKMKVEMESMQNTYPERVSADLANQYLEIQDISEMDVVAGATYSSEAFTALFTALEPQMRAGNTDPLVIKNIPEK